MKLPAPPVLLITDRAQAAAPLETIVAAALEAGCRWVLLREKDLEPGARLRLLRRLVDLGRDRGAKVMVSGVTSAAGAAGVPGSVWTPGAAGVHLPAGGNPAEVRRALGPEALIGVSCHGLAEAEAAAGGGADYVTLSPVFESPSKPGYGPALGPEGVRAVAARLVLPVIALGGIAPSNAAACLKAGAAGVAVMGEIMRAESPAKAMEALLSTLQRAPGGLD